MENELYNSSWMGMRTIVYPDRIAHKKIGGILGLISIPLKQIASVSVSISGNAKIETTGGKIHTFPIGISPAKVKEFKQVVDSLLVK